MEEDECDFQVATDEPEPDSEHLAVAALEYTSFKTADWLHTARAVADAVAAAPNQHY